MTAVYDPRRGGRRRHRRSHAWMVRPLPAVAVIALVLWSIFVITTSLSTIRYGLGL